MKKALLVLSFLCAALVIGCKNNERPTSPGDPSTETPLPKIEGLEYRVQNGAIIITKIYDTDDGVMIIPEENNGLPVISIAAGAAKDLSALNYIVIPDSVTNIGEGAFEGTGLVAAWLPKDVPAIGADAFPLGAIPYVPYTIGNIPSEYTDALSTVTALPLVIPIANTISNYTGATAFVYIPPTADGNAITAIAAGDSLAYAFTNVRTTLARVSAPSVATIGDYAFYQCANLTAADVPQATTIGFAAFYQCASLIRANVPQTTMVGERAFYGCALTNADFPNTTTISDSAFQNCSNLIRANFPEATTVSAWAFNACSHLTNATIPKATSIGVSAFQNCSNLMSANFPQAITIGESAFQDTSLASANFPKVTAVSDSAFQNCLNLSTANFPEATTIAYRAFYQCSNLTTAAVNAATSIGASAFQGCLRLTNATFGAVTSIGISAFANCSNLASITLKRTTPPSMGTTPFLNTPPTKKLYVPSAAVSAYASWMTTYTFGEIVPIL